MDSFAETLIHLLARLNLSQAEFASAIGVSPQVVNHWVKGRNYPSLPDAAKIAKKLGISLDQLVGISDEPDPRGAILTPKQRAILAVSECRLIEYEEDGEGLIVIRLERAPKAGWGQIGNRSDLSDPGTARKKALQAKSLEARDGTTQLKTLMQEFEKSRDFPQLLKPSWVTLKTAASKLECDPVMLQRLAELDAIHTMRFATRFLIGWSSIHGRFLPVPTWVPIDSLNVPPPPPIIVA